MQDVIRGNARYWLRVLQNVPGDSLLAETDLRGAAKAIEASLRIPDLWDVTKSLVQAIHPHMEQRGFWADWDECLQVLIECARQQSDKQAEAEILLWRGIIQSHRGDFQLAMFSCRRAWFLYRNTKKDLGLSNVFSQLGYIYRLRRQFWRAEVLCLVAVRSFDDGQFLHELAQAENRLGLVYFDHLQYSEALPHFLRAQALWQQLGDVYGLAKVLHNLGELHRLTKDFDTSFRHLQEALQHYLAAGDEIYAALTHVDIGNIYLNQNDLFHAESAYLYAETILRREGDSLNLAKVRNNLGMIYTRFGNWNEAKDCFERALEQWRARGDIWNEANTLGEMGMLSLAYDDRTNAKSCFDEAWALLRGHNGALFELLRHELAERRKLVS